MTNLAMLLAIVLSATPADDATALALADARRIPSMNAHKIRYIHIDGEPGEDVKADAQGAIFVVNMVSRAPVLVKPDVVVDVKSRRSFLLRINTRLLANDGKDWLDFLDAWEEMSHEPAYSAFITDGQADLVREFHRLFVGGNVRRWKTVNGFRVLEYEEAMTALKRDGVVRSTAHLSKEWHELADLLKTEAPIITNGYFTFRATSSIQDAQRKVYRRIFGGLYYRLAGVPSGTKDDLAALLKTVGVDTGKQNVFDADDKLRAIQRAAMWRSRVTGKQRRVDLLKSRAGREHQGLVAITTDFGRADRDIDQSPMANLLDVKRAKAHEVIWEKVNGFHGFALYDANLRLQESAPPDVVADRTVPAPHETDLQAGISCVRCHGLHRLDGWQPVPNDVLTAIRSRRWDVFGDLRKGDQDDTLLRLAGLYGGDLYLPLQRGRHDYARAVLAVTGPWRGSKNQTDAVAQASSRVADVYRRWWYDPVTAADVLRTRGIDPGDDPALKFHQMTTLPVAGFVSEPAPVSALRVGLAVNRADWAIIEGHVRLQSQR